MEMAALGRKRKGLGLGRRREDPGKKWRDGGMRELDLLDVSQIIEFDAVDGRGMSSFV